MISGLFNSKKTDTNRYETKYEEDSKEAEIKATAGFSRLDTEIKYVSVSITEHNAIKQNRNSTIPYYYKSFYNNIFST